LKYEHFGIHIDLFLINICLKAHFWYLGAPGSPLNIFSTFLDRNVKIILRIIVGVGGGGCWWKRVSGAVGRVLVQTLVVLVVFVVWFWF